MRRENSEIKTGFVSEAGTRLQNHDYFAFVELNKFACYVLADGIDEDMSESGEIAVKEILRLFMENPTMNAGRLRGFLRTAGKLLINKTKDAALEASVMVLVTDYVSFRYAQAGNVRLCHIRNGVVAHESADMSLAQRLADKGELSLDKVTEHEERHNLSCYLGQRTNRFLPIVSKKRKMEDGDLFALYTRGVWEKLSANDVLQASEGMDGPKQWADSVEELVLEPSPAGTNEFVENYSFVAIAVNKTYQNAENRKKLIKKLLAIGIPVLVIAVTLTVVLLVRHHIRTNDINEMNDAWADAKAATETNNFAKASEKANAAYALAQKLKLPDERQKLLDFTILLDHIIAGDEAMRDKKYEDAHDAFEAAEEKSYYSDLLAADYIDAKRRLAVDHLELQDLLNRGDTALDDEDFEAASGYYMRARDLAMDLRAADEKSLAWDGLKNVRALLSEQSAESLKIEAQSHEKRGEETPEIAEEQYRLAAELYKRAGDSAAEGLVLEKLDKLQAERADEERNIAVAKAQTLEQNGDLALDAHQYALARNGYMEAQSIYLEHGMPDMSQAVGQKLLQVFRTEQDGAKELERANDYMSDGDSYFVKGEFAKARMLYQMAQEIYEELGLLEDMEKAGTKIEQVDERNK
jgi:serine/threonine protein phosphatase PrpC